jgi:hypothetical protein
MIGPAVFLILKERHKMNANSPPPQLGEWKRATEIKLEDGAVYYSAIMSGRGWLIQFVRCHWNERTRTAEMREMSIPNSEGYYEVSDYQWFAEAIGQLPDDMLRVMSPDR